MLDSPPASAHKPAMAARASDRKPESSWRPSRRPHPPVLPLQPQVLGAQCSVLGARCSVLGPRSSVLGPRCSEELLPSCCCGHTTWSWRRKASGLCSVSYCWTCSPSRHAGGVLPHCADASFLATLRKVATRPISLHGSLFFSQHPPMCQTSD